MLIITEQDINTVFDAGEVVAAIEKAYSIQDEASTLIPDRTHIDYNQNTLLLMPGFTKEVAGTKLVGVFPENKTKGKPVIYGQMILNDITTGEPLALINGSKLTAVRTGAVGAAAVKHLAPESAKILGVIGAGVQGLHQILMAAHLRDFKTILIADFNKQQAEKTAAKAEAAFPGISVKVSASANELVTQSHIIITTTTATTPVFNVEKNQLRDKLFIGIGSYKPDMIELPPEIMETAQNIFVDTLHAMDESGDLAVPLKNGVINKQKIVPFGKLLTSKADRNGTNVFKSVGMALFDLTVADYLYKKCLKNNMGTEIEL
jgi:ornithine cyclodeaminase